jgi:predicted Zn-dependent protease
MFTEEEFHLVNSDTLNAFTTGGEHAYIYTKLMQECKNEDELAAVVAHEYGHVYARHVHKGMNRQYQVIGTAVAAGAAGYALGGEQYALYGAGLGAAAGQFLSMGFTRADEAEADELGFAFYTRAGWDPDRFGGFFQTLIDQGYDTASDLTSDHPTLASRVAAARERAAALPPEARTWRRPPVADAARFEQLKQRATRVGARQPDDQAAARAQLFLASLPSCLLPHETAEQAAARETLEQAAAADETQPRRRRQR